MADAENALPSSKKRAAGREISRDNPGLDDDDGGSNEQDVGTFKRASDEVLASRKIVKVRRTQNGPSSSETAPSSNPFAGIHLVPDPVPTAVTAEVGSGADKGSEDKNDDGSKETEVGKTKTDEPVPETAVDEDSTENKEPSAVEETKQPVTGNENPVEDKHSGDDRTTNEGKECDKTEAEDKEGEKKGSEDKGSEEKINEDKKDSCNENAGSTGEGSAFISFQKLSSNTNAFSGVAGTGFSASTFTFGSAATDGSASGTSGTLPFSFGLPHNGSSSLFGSTGAPIGSKIEGAGFQAMQEIPVETGEENERTVFSAESVLFEFSEGSWKERGKGELKVNVSITGSERARLLMRTRGNLRLVLNASLYPDMKLTNMDKRGITFACVNSAGESNSKDGLSTCALKFKDGSVVEEFCSAVTSHKDKTRATATTTTTTTNSLRTPENSPKASDE